MKGVSTYCGEAGLIPFLNATDILVVLLPLTTRTQGIINYGVLKELRRRKAHRALVTLCVFRPTGMAKLRASLARRLR